jgi:phospholipid-binding lipoprotein MlaA
MLGEYLINKNAGMLFRILIITMSLTISLTALGKGGRCYQIYDPYEESNRRVFKFNRMVDRNLFRPVVKIYNNAVPDWGKQRVSSFFYNIKEPLSFLNYTLQGKGAEAGKAFWRFFVNTIFGIGGLFDFASKFDLTIKQQTFSNTMAHYNMNYGAYLVVPVFGSFTTRDVFARAIDTFTDPMGIVWVRHFDGTLLEYNTANAANARIRNDDLLEDIENSSLDHYSKTRSLYLQSLAGQDPTCEQEEETIKYD